MKKAKIILLSLVILISIFTALAVRNNRFGPPSLYSVIGTKLSTINVGGITYSTTIPNCVLTLVCTTFQGNPVRTSTSSTNAQVFVEFTANGHLPITRTYVYCAQTFTRTIECD